VTHTPPTFTLHMKIVYSSKILVYTYHTTWHHRLGYNNMDSQTCYHTKVRLICASEVQQIHCWNKWQYSAVLFVLCLT
jgi:hypothetical protein